MATHPDWHLMFRNDNLKLSDYAYLIGFGEDPDSEQGKLAEHGGFVAHIRDADEPHRNGIYEIIIDDGDQQNTICKDFTATLYQRTDDGAEHPPLVFPHQVESLEEMQSRSLLQQPLSHIFDLASKIACVVEEEMH